MKQFTFWRTRTGQQTLANTAALVVLLVGAFIIMVPFFWMLSTSFKAADEVYAIPTIWIPREFQWQNYVTVVTRFEYTLYAKNTFLLVSTVMIGTLFSATFSAYAFARLRAPTPHARRC